MLLNAWVYTTKGGPRKEWAGGNEEGIKPVL